MSDNARASCPRCSSYDVHNTNFPGMSQCNTCGRVFRGSTTAKPNIEIMDFLERLCRHSPTTKIYFTLLKEGGAHRFTDIRAYMGISQSVLSPALSQLLVDGLLIMSGRKYQAISPIWLKEEK